MAKRSNDKRGGKPLTRPFRDLVRARAVREPKFRHGLARGAITCIRAGEYGAAIYTLGHLVAADQALALKRRASHREYPVTLTADDNGTWLVQFPDLPGAITFGGTMKQALAQGRDALVTRLNSLMAAGQPIPAVSRRRSMYAVTLPARYAAKLRAYVAGRRLTLRRSKKGGA